jgi:uncharacterized protein YutE (UPF0331/DUF86 family)
LLEKKEYRAAVTSAISLIESELRERLSSDKRELRMRPMMQLVDIAQKAELISASDSIELKHWMSIRTRLVHEQSAIDSQKAIEIVTNIMKILNKLQKNDQ